MPYKDPTVLNIVDKQSLIHVGSLDSFDITEGGKNAARLILEYLDKPDPDRLNEAIDIYETIIPNENFGGEYTALEWMCRYFLMDDKKKQDIEAHPEVRGFKNMMVKNDHDNLKTYLKYKYHIVEYGDGDNTELKARMRFLEDYILFTGRIPAEGVWRYYAAGDVFVSASVFEVHSMSYLEALANGLPLLCRADDALIGVLEHNRNGLIYHSKDEFVHFAYQLLSDDSLRKDMAHASYQKAEDFSSDAFAASVFRVYEEVAGRRAEEE